MMLMDRQHADPVGFHLARARGEIVAAREAPQLGCVRDRALANARNHLQAARLITALQFEAAQIEALVMLAAGRQIETALTDLWGDRQ